jgi:hypothetical protein
MKCYFEASFSELLRIHESIHAKSVEFSSTSDDMLTLSRLGFGKDFGERARVAVDASFILIAQVLESELDE